MPPKGTGALPFGPCANLNCSNNLCHPIQCYCKGTDGNLNVHSFLDPRCTRNSKFGKLRVDGPPGSVGSVTCRVIDMTQRQLDYGRKLARDAGQDGSDGRKDTGSKSGAWQKVPNEGMRRLMGIALMPSEAVACPACFSTFKNWNTSYKTSEQTPQKVRDNATAVITENLAVFLAQLSDEFLLVLLALVTLFGWLSKALSQFGNRTPDADQCAVWLSGNHQGTDVSWTGGFVVRCGPAGRMPIVAAALIEQAVALCDSAALPFQVLTETMGREYWIAVGTVLRGKLRVAATERIAKIRAKQLHSLCNWTDDFKTLGEDLGLFVMYATASDEERTVGISAVRSRQKFRERYFIMLLLLHCVDYKCNQPMHKLIHKLAYTGDLRLIQHLFPISVASTTDG